MLSRSMAVVWCGIALVFGWAVTPAAAAELTLSATVGEILQPDLTPFPEGENPGISSLHGTPLSARIDFFMEIGALQANELGFGNTAFDVELNGVAQSAFAPGWQPDVSTIDLNGATPGGIERKWYECRDIGPSTWDLSSVYVGLFPRNFDAIGVDPRRTLGQMERTLLGSVFVDWNGLQSSLVRLNYSSAGGFSTYDEDLMLSVNDGSTHFGAVLFGGPEELRTSVQVLDWDSHPWQSKASLEQSFALNGVDLTVKLSGDTQFAPLENTAEAGPFTGRQLSGDTPEENALNLVLDWSDSAQQLTTELGFSQVVRDVGFVLHDVDADPELAFVDEVTVVGYLGDAIVLPELLDGTANDVLGNTVTGVGPGALSDGDVQVYFSQPIDRIELLFGGGAHGALDPALQGISLHDVRFATIVPEPASICIAAALAFVGLAARRRSMFG